MAFASLCSQALPHAIIAELHGATLRWACNEGQSHFQGLAQAGRTLKKQGLITPSVAKQLLHLDIAFAWTRHANMNKAKVFLDSLPTTKAMSTGTSLGTGPPQNGAEEEGEATTAAPERKADEADEEDTLKKEEKKA